MRQNSNNERAAFTLIELLVVVASAAKTEYWQIHSRGRNVMFSNGHAKRYKTCNPGEMTFSYTTWPTGFNTHEYIPKNISV